MLRQLPTMPIRSAIWIVLLTTAVLIPLPVRAADHQTAVACETAVDCGCGLALDDGNCRIGHPSELRLPPLGDPCRELCMEPLCVGAQCMRRAAAGCPLDCDGDLMTTVDEIVLGTNIVLGLQPIGACPTPGLGAPRIDVTAIVRAVDAGLEGCVNQIDSRVGGTVLNVELDGSDGAVAISSSYDGVIRYYSIALRPYADINLTIPVGVERGELENAHLLYTDYGIGLRGTFAVELDARTETIRVELQPTEESPLPLPSVIVMRRLLHPEASSFGGTYRFTMSLDPVARSASAPLSGTFRLSVNARGAGVMSEMVLRTETGDLRARISGTACAVSAAGNLSCNGTYFVEGSAIASDPSPSTLLGVTDRFNLTGQIRTVDGSANGSGSYQVGTDPPFAGLYTRGSWEAERLNEGP